MANYPIPPWLNVSPPDFGTAAARGAEISLARARLAQEAQQAGVRASLAQMELNARREQEQQQSQRAEQELAIQKAYHESQIGLKQQELDQAAQEFQMQVKDAALKSQIQQEYQARVRAGEDPSKVLMELGPIMGLTGSGMASLARKPVELGGVTPIDLGGKKAFGVRVGEGSMQLYVPPPETGTNAIQSVPVLGPNGEAIPGVFGVPSPTGMRIHNVPQETRASALNKRVEQRKAALGNTSTGTTGGGKSIQQQKVDRAYELAKEHPDWSKPQITNEVNKEFKGR